jgi:hypothetical protein
MEKKDLISKEVERTFHTLDGIERVDANPFLFGKITHNLEDVNPVEKKFNFKFALVAVVVCLLINFATMFYESSNNYTTGTYSNSDSVRTAQIESFASEYSSTNNFYFY